MHHASRRLASIHAFTLVELLTVIAIITILMGLLFPVFGIVREQMRRAQARNDVAGIVAAVKQFQTDYGKYPSVTATTAGAGDDSLVGDTAAKATIDNSALFDTLRAIDRGLNAGHRLNPRRIVFFEGRAAGNSLEPRAGFADGVGAAKLGCFFDPWGRQYAVVMDTNYDNQLTLTEQYRDYSGDHAPRVGAGAFALGKDNQLGTKGDGEFRKGTTFSDDVISWQ